MHTKKIVFADREWDLVYEFVDGALTRVLLCSDDASLERFVAASAELTKDTLEAFVPIHARAMKQTGEETAELARLREALEKGPQAQRKNDMIISLPTDCPLTLVFLQRFAISFSWFRSTTAEVLLDRAAPNGRAATLQRDENGTTLIFWLPNPW